MQPSSLPPTNWIAVTESQFPWEREALEFIRAQFPKQEPYRAWANFEFIAGDGSINEVDLLVFTPQGFFLIEIKSRPGTIVGNQRTWTWEEGSKRHTCDNPLFATNRKAKRLRSLLENQSAFRNRQQVPFIEPLVFCSHPQQRLDLSWDVRQRVCLRDKPATSDISPRAGIMAAILQRDCEGLTSQPKGLHDRSTSRQVARAMEDIGIKPSQRSRQVGDHILSELMEGEDNANYQDWRATHVQLADITRRIRVYLIRPEASQQDREMVRRSAEREFQILEGLQHPNILRCYGLTRHELGHALILEYPPDSMRLDRYLAQRQHLSLDIRLSLMRQIAEAIRFAHEKRVVHRGLSPQSILVAELQPDRPTVKLFNWQLGYRAGSVAAGRVREVTATSHVDRLVDDISQAYLAPEALSDVSALGEYLDIFSLGAIAFHLFAGVPPAANGLELNEKLRETVGLHISAVLNGAPQSLQDLIKASTHPLLDERLESVTDFLAGLDRIEEDLTAALATPDTLPVDNPSDAQKGDLLPGGFLVLKRLGQGATSIGFLVQKGDREFILKVANDPDHNPKLKDEAEVLQKLHHPNIVEMIDAPEIGNRAALLLKPVLVKRREESQVETLGQRLRREGKLHIDLLQRFGDDLLSAVNYLEQQGINHRDIKPDNAAIGQIRGRDKLRLVLFDFSLARTPVDNIRAGTTGYLEPLLCLRQPRRWDLHAERYAAAIALYEMATGTLPVWGDGATDPSFLDCEITLEPELMEANLRERLVDFFRQAFRRQPQERFDNAETMLQCWRDCFAGIEQPGALLDAEDESMLRDRLEHATFDTPMPDLGLGLRATNALDIANLLTVRDMLAAPRRRLARLRGIGNLTRREILAAVRILHDRLGVPSDADISEETTDDRGEEPQRPSVDALVKRATRLAPKEEIAVRRALLALLGLDAEITDPFPSQADLAQQFNLSREQVNQWLGRFQKRWTKDTDIVQLRRELADLLHQTEGIMTAEELTVAVLAAWGSAQDEPLRSRYARALLRVAVEVENTMTHPRFYLGRDRDRVLLAVDWEFLDYGRQLGDVADRLAAADPLVSPDRALQQLREVPLPANLASLSDSRCLRLAAAASHQAALSSRQEFYPRHMEPERALRLAQGAVYAGSALTVSQIQERVNSRYPEATPLPQRPELDRLIQSVAPTLVWDATACQGQGGYVSQAREYAALTSSTSLNRLSTADGLLGQQEITPEIADARQFEERLQRSYREGAFLALLVTPQRYQRAIQELTHRFDLHLVDYEALFLTTLRQTADKARVDWQKVLAADATPQAGDWDKLMLLVARAMPAIATALTATDRTILLIYPGLLARYRQMTLLDDLREQVGRAEGIPGLWILVPNEQQAMVEGQPIPLLSPGQRARIPDGWLSNRHRAGIPSNTSLPSLS